MARRLLLTLGLAWLTGCASLPMVEAPSANHNSRIQFLVLHFTSEPFARSMHLLTQRTERPVSAHYLVPEPGDETYPHDALKIFRLVPEERRAWHAGVSSWRGKPSLNSSSLGIEIVNLSRCESTDPKAEVQTPETQSCTFLEFPEAQIDLVIELIQDILARHPEIDPFDVVAHSDIAPARRLDPGPTFPWKRLSEHGIGAWYDEETVGKYRQLFAHQLPSIERIQRALGAYGYALEPTGDLDVRTRFVVRAFQAHFRPSRLDGQIDLETCSILFALLEKYRPRRLAKLLPDDSIP